MICASRFAKDGKLLSTLTLFNHCRHDVTGSVGSRARPAWIASQVFIFLVLLKVIFYFHPYLGAFWGLFFFRFLKQIQVFVQNLFGRFMAKMC